MSANAGSAVFAVLMLEICKVLKMARPVYRSAWDAPYTHEKWGKEGWFFAHVVCALHAPLLFPY